MMRLWPKNKAIKKAPPQSAPLLGRSSKWNSFSNGVKLHPVLMKKVRTHAQTSLLRPLPYLWRRYQKELCTAFRWSALKTSRRPEVCRYRCLSRGNQANARWQNNVALRGCGPGTAKLQTFERAINRARDPDFWTPSRGAWSVQNKKVGQSLVGSIEAKSWLFGRQLSASSQRAHAPLLQASSPVMRLLPSIG